MPGIPHTTPRALQSFIRRVRAHIIGLYIECESDVVLFNYLTYHVFGKLAWNPDTDVEKLLEHHAKAFYGPAAVPMKDFFDSIERNWGKIAANAVETPMGPKTVYPSELVLWGSIYTPAELKRLTALFDRAEKLAAKDAVYLKRIKFVREEMLRPILEQAAAYYQVTDAVQSWKFFIGERKGQITVDGSPEDPGWRDATEMYLSGLNGAPAEVVVTPAPGRQTVEIAQYRDLEVVVFRFPAGEGGFGPAAGQQRRFDAETPAEKSGDEKRECDAEKESADLFWLFHDIHYTRNGDFSIILARGLL